MCNPWFGEFDDSAINLNTYHSSFFFTKSLQLQICVQNEDTSQYTHEWEGQEGGVSLAHRTDSFGV